MEKLLKLINEYHYNSSEVCKYLYDDEAKKVYFRTVLDNGDAYEERIDDERIISKRFGFIKWLVDNDKIDLDKLKDNTSFTTLTHSIGLGCEWHTAHEGENILRVIGTNAIIAYLSIQDNPIEFLISILK